MDEDFDAVRPQPPSQVLPANLLEAWIEAVGAVAAPDAQGPARRQGHHGRDRALRERQAIVPLEVARVDVHHPRRVAPGGPDAPSSADGRH